ncbi:hypothetical protein [Hyphobacterium sp.]|uniref:hypothetical protein n=1 Tax=Hyphobacterium sp. TaxID=2004662 RepID=UPI00374875C1
MSFFTKRVRVGTVGAAAAKPVFKEVVDWGAIAGTAVVVFIVLAVIGNVAG